MSTEAQRAVFRRALRQARDASGLSQRALARELGVSASAVSQWELGETAPRPSTVSGLERLLELDEGALQRILGYLPPSTERAAAVSVLEAVEADPRLGPRERDLLASMYEQLVRQRAAGRTGDT